jgi:hypothetical protein
MRNMTIKQIKEVYKNYKTVGNEKNSFVVTHYVGYGKCVIVVNSNKIYGKTITQIIRVEDGKELLQENIRPCDNLSDALDVAEEMLRERLSENKEYEHTPGEMADKLMEFIRDMGDDEDQIEEEKKYVAELFNELQKSEKFEILAHYFDLMFMDSAFK